MVSFLGSNIKALGFMVVFHFISNMLGCTCGHLFYRATLLIARLSREIIKLPQARVDACILQMGLIKETSPATM